MEKLFAVQRMEDFMLADHPLLLIRTLVYAALIRMDELFAQMCSRNHERSPAHCVREVDAYEVSAGAPKRPLGAPVDETGAMELILLEMM
ncbi:hypothetical protein ACLB90_07150 [Stenotrophomonas sp. LGBM10]|uniref:hypothetical protein n=1 Tax=Stenotrophomonas sp. LGBM10 TaxID=3390038 RepID=UPI00398ABAC2